MKRSRILSLMPQIGMIFKLYSFLLLTPIISLVWHPEEYMFYLNFLIPSILLNIAGRIIIHIFKDYDVKVLKKVHQVVFVVLIWFLGCVLLSIPFMTSGYLNFSQAFFETSSGLSTTGLSVIDVTNVEYMLLIYRSMIQFYGGIGIILILVTVFSSSIGFELFQTEGHGDRIIPNLKDASKTIIKIYVLFMFFGFILLTLAGMPSFDAFNIAICAVATGGFAVTPDSIASYDSTLINYIIIVLMLLGSFSFYTNQFVVKGQLRKVFAINEVRLFFGFIISFVFISVFATMMPIYGFVEGFNVALFEIVSAITGTGFSLTDYSTYLVVNQTFFFIMIIAMVIGGSVGSTAGGIKITRVNTVFTSLKWNIKRNYMPDNKLISRSINAPSGKVRLSSPDIVVAANYIILYITVLLGGTILLTMFGFGLSESLFEFASALGNVGLSVGITSPDLPSIILWILSIAMFIGRLEIFVVIIFIIKVTGSVKTRCECKIRRNNEKGVSSI